jgi:lysophospholipase L1-like esterase
MRKERFFGSGKSVRSTTVAAAVTLFLAAAAIPTATVSVRAEMLAKGPSCSAPAALLRLQRPLPHVAARLADGGPLKIVAFGSSSTLGFGASTPEMTYPARLQSELRRRHPKNAITVVNRGVNGNETREMMLRFEMDVLDEKPDLVIWQAGTNTLLNGHDMWPVFLDVRSGIRRLRAQGSDVLLMNPQYSPRVLARPGHEAMNDLVEVIGRELEVDVFDRFGIMRNWAEGQRYPMDTFITADGLHMNDWAYDCVANLLADVVGKARVSEIAKN